MDNEVRAGGRLRAASGRAQVIVALVAMLSCIGGTQTVQAHLDTLWTRSQSGGVVYAPAGMGVDRWNNVYVASEYCGPDTGILVVKYDEFGRQQWSRSYSAAGHNYCALCATVDSSGNVYLTGNEIVGRYCDCVTWKYSASGQLEWVAQFPPWHPGPPGYVTGMRGTQAAIDSQGNVLVAGWEEDLYPVAQGLLFTLKYTPDGNLLWADSIPYKDNTLWCDWPRLAVDRQGNAYFSPGPTAANIYTLGKWRIYKYGPDGDLKWAVTHAPSDSNSVRELAIDRDGNVLAIGGCKCQGSKWDICTAKYRPDGSEIWIAHLDIPDAIGTGGVKVVAGDSGSVYVMGDDYDQTSAYHSIVVKYLPTGEPAWVRRYIGPNPSNYGLDMTVDRYNNAYVAGYDDNGGTDRPFVLRYSSSGVQIWDDHDLPSWCSASSLISLDTSGDVYVSGVGGAGTFLAKYTQVKEWCMLAWSSGDNDLETAAVHNVNEMESGVDPDSCYLIDELDMLNDWNAGPLAHRYFINPDNSPDDSIRSGILMNRGEDDMGCGDSLADFVTWAMRRFPARKYCLACDDHGDAWHFGDPPRFDFSGDWTNDHDHIKVAGEDHELRRALQRIRDSTGRKLDLLCFDCCLMAMAEVECECKGLVNYVVHSEETEDEDGYPYDDVLGWLNQHRGASPREFAAGIVNTVGDWYVANPDDRSSTQSAVDLGPAYDEFRTALGVFAAELIKAGGMRRPGIDKARKASQRFDDPDYTFVDLVDFATKIAQTESLPAELRQAANLLISRQAGCLLAERHVSHEERNVDNAHGIAIADSFVADENLMEYGRLALSQSTLWDEYAKGASHLPEGSCLQYASNSLQKLGLDAGWGRVPMRVTLQNFGDSAARGILARVSVNDPYATLLQDTSSFPDCPGSDSVASSSEFLLLIDSTAPLGYYVPLTLTVTSGAGAGETLVTDFTLDVDTGATGVMSEAPNRPKPVLALAQNRPNPANGHTVIDYSLPVAGSVSLRVYDVTGKLIKSLAEGHQNLGYHTVTWDGSDRRGRRISPGVYFYSLKALGRVLKRKMLMLKSSP